MQGKVEYSANGGEQEDLDHGKENEEVADGQEDSKKFFF